MLASQVSRGDPSRLDGGRDLEKRRMQAYERTLWKGSVNG
jgi:hypothetical protein